MRALCLAVVLLSSLAGRSLAAEVPQRIVSLAPSLTEIVYALGLGERLVGVSTHCNYPPEVLAIDKVGSFVTPAIERVVAKRPDIVLAEPNIGNRHPVESLQRLGLDVLVVDAKSLAEVRESFVTVARRLGVEARGEALAAKLDADIAATVARLGDVTPRRTLLVVGRQPLIVAGRGTLQDELLGLARAVNLGGEGGAGWPHLSIERVVRAAPEVIIDATMGGESAAESAVAFWRDLAAIPAVRQDRVTVYEADDLLRPGPRLGAALARLARLIHPERFAIDAGGDDVSWVQR